jgi:hypothetical protein
MDKPEEQQSSGVVDHAEKWFADAYHSVAGAIKSHPGEAALGTAGTAAVVAGLVLAPEVTLPVLAIGAAGALTGCTAEVTSTPDTTPLPAPTPDVCSSGPPPGAIIVDSSIGNQYTPFSALPGDQIEVVNGGVVDTTPGSVTWVDPGGTAINDGGTICASPDSVVIESKTGSTPGLVVESAKVTPQASPQGAPAAN